MSLFATQRKSITLCRPFQREDSRLAELARFQLALTTAVEEGQAAEEGEQCLPFPDFVDKAFYFFEQTTRPRSWCLSVISSPYPFTETVISYSAAVLIVCLPVYTVR